MRYLPPPAMAPKLPNDRYRGGVFAAPYVHRRYSGADYATMPNNSPAISRVPKNQPARLPLPFARLSVAGLGQAPLYECPPGARRLPGGGYCVSVAGMGAHDDAVPFLSYPTADMPQGLARGGIFDDSSVPTMFHEPRYPIMPTTATMVMRPPLTNPSPLPAMSGFGAEPEMQGIFASRSTYNVPVAWGGDIPYATEEWVRQQTRARRITGGPTIGQTLAAAQAATGQKVRPQGIPVRSPLMRGTPFR